MPSDNDAVNGLSDFMSLLPYTSASAFSARLTAVAESGTFTGVVADCVVCPKADRATAIASTVATTVIFMPALYRRSRAEFQSQRIVDVNRWDEKAGLRRDAIRSQVIDALEAQEIKETGNEEE
jgi:hypothetical protein